jgi:hypothetical protein
MPRLRRITAVLAALAAVAAYGAVLTGAGGKSQCPNPLRGRHDLGRLAFIQGQRLEVLQVTACRARTLVRGGVEPPLRWSADGRYLAYGGGNVVSATDGLSKRPLGRLGLGWGSGSLGWVWSPKGHRLAGVTTGGGVVVGGPGTKTRRLLPDGWGATSIAWSPNGRLLAVSRSLYLKVPPPYHQEIWLLDLRSAAKRLLLHLPKPEIAPPYLSGFSPDGRWLLAWEDIQNSASLAADGLPLVALPVAGGKPVKVGKGTLVYGDFISWCSGNQLAYVLDNGGREVSGGDRINFAGPAPRWPTVTPADPGTGARLSFISPACSPPNLFQVAAAVGPTSGNAYAPFGHEHRSIWLLISTGGNWHPLEPPPPQGSSDELPIWSHDGRWLAFIRTTWTGDAGAGQLYLLELGKRSNGHARRIGPIARIGSTGNYYGHYNWEAQVAWYTR